jgi:hypothetical protein
VGEYETFEWYAWILPKHRLPPVLGFWVATPRNQGMLQRNTEANDIATKDLTPTFDPSWGTRPSTLLL